MPLWLPRARGQRVILRVEHIASKVLRNLLSASTTTTATIPKDKTTCSMKRVARDAAVGSVTMVEITN